MPNAPQLNDLWNETVLLFGYTGFFSLMFPIVALWSAIISFIHLNFMYYRFTTSIRRPIAVE